MVGALRPVAVSAPAPVAVAAAAPVQAASAPADGGGGGGRQAGQRRGPVSSPVAAMPAPARVTAPAAAIPASPAGAGGASAGPGLPQPLQPPGGGADPTAFRATEVVALAQLVLSRNFHGPVRMATAQELLYQARSALAKGESSLASDLASLAARVMAPAGHDGTGRHISAESMQGGGGAVELPPVSGAAQAQASGLQGGVPPAPAALVPLQGLAPLTLRERGVVLQPPPARPRLLAPRLATDGTPRGIPRT